MASGGMAQPTPDVGSVPLRTTAVVTAGTYEHVASDLVTAWHHHDLHEIEYAVSGVAELRTETSHFVLPPQHAAWVPAGVPHCPILRDVHTIAVFFDPAAFDLPSREAVVFPVPPVLREMIRYAARWPIFRSEPGGEEPFLFFHAIKGVVRRQLEHEPPATLAIPDDPIVAEVIAYTADHLADVTAASVCRAVGISERTLRRRFPAVVGETWREHLHRARLTHAMPLLHDQTRSIRDVAMAAGFDSPSAFTRAFKSWTGETPSAYRSRCLAARAQPSAG